MRLIYLYNNNEPRIHTTFVSRKTEDKEGKDSTRVEIWKITDYDYQFNPYLITYDEEGYHVDLKSAEYITTKIL